jgi:photosystem II stability/assembly factor-like uncharacterized protein
VQPITGLRFNQNYSSLFFIGTNGWIIMDSSIFRSNGSINNWSEASFNVQPLSLFTGIYAPSASIIYAVTEAGQVYKSTDAGVNFSLLTVFSPANAFADIHFVDDNTGYVSYDKKIFKTSDGGITWQTVVTMATKTFIEINFTDANHGWACGDTLLIFKQ